MKKKHIYSLFVIALIIVFSLSATYAYMLLSTSNSNSTGVGGCFEVYYSGETLGENSTLQSTTNYLEGSHSQVTLSKQEGCDIYTTAQIHLHTNSESTAPLSEAFKYKVYQGTTLISEGSITETLNEEGTQIDNLLATVPLSEEQVVYDIYIWIDSNLSNGAYNDKTYTGYIYATSIQTSTVTK